MRRRKRRPIISFIIALLACIAPCAALEWSEILPNPAGNDNGKEFIELRGSEDLTGCELFDNGSKDTLVKLAQGTDTILIVENDTAILTGDATAYSIGSAIGNGLGNAQDTLTIRCENETLLTTTYQTGTIEGYVEGTSLVWISGSATWTAGTSSGTPGGPNRQGTVENTTTQTDKPSNATTQTTVRETAPSLSNGKTASTNDSRSCNASLEIIVSKVDPIPGDVLTFSIVADAYAWFDIMADNKTILEGDTLSGPQRSMLVPRSSRLRITAHSAACGANVRTSRSITVQLPTNEVVLDELYLQEQNDSPAKEPTKKSDPEELRDARIQQKTPLSPSDNNTTLSEIENSVARIEQDSERADTHRGGENATTMQSAISNTETDVSAVTGAIATKVIVDEDRQLVPWIATFGIVTIAVSAFVFFRKEQ